MKKIDHYTVDAENPSSWDEYFYRIAATVNKAKVLVIQTLIE